MTIPKVSVIIPNYNYARFLKKRIQSVLQQTYQNIEVIYLDDASTDNSIEIFEKFAHDKRIRGMINKVNSGSVFKIWNKGVKHAKGEYIWIAESDDYADKRFLERLVEKLDSNLNVGIAYCQSWQIDEHDRVLLKYDEHYMVDLDPERWKRDFIASGKDMCRNYLIFKNIVPNASAVVFRRSLYQMVGGTSENMKLAGDWLLWSKILLVSDSAYIVEPLNYFRTHDRTNRHVYDRNGILVKESFEVIQYIAQNIDVSPQYLDKTIYDTVALWIDTTWQYHIPLKRQGEIYRGGKGVYHKVEWLLLKSLTEKLLMACKRKIRELIAMMRIKLKIRTRLRRIINDFIKRV